jgi:hypothetical protein
MTADVRELALWVANWGAAVERPDVVAARDDMMARFVSASIRPPAPERAPKATTFAYVDLGELPLD